MICEIIMGSSDDKIQKLTKDILGAYKQEVEVLEGLQMKMFLDKLQNFGLSDSLNLKLLNANFRKWLEKALELKD